MKFKPHFIIGSLSEKEEGPILSTIHHLVQTLQEVLEEGRSWLQS